MDIPLIAGARARAVTAPLAQPIRTAAGTIPSAPVVLIDVEIAEGPTGHAYLFGYTPVALRPLVALVENLVPLMVGKPLAPQDRMRDMAAAFRLLGRQGLLGMAISGLDMALWDAVGRLYGVSVCRLLGGAERPIPAYASFGIIDPARDLDAIGAAVRDGFRAIKIKIGASDLAADVATVSAVRELVGSTVALMVDYNQTLTVPEAVRRIRRLEEYDLTWIEEPVAAEDLAGHADVRARVAAGIQTGENWWFPEDVARAVNAGASDFAMLDLMKIGGISGWMRAAGQAEGASLPVSSHLFVEASAHALTVTSTGHFLEHLDVASRILRDPVVPVDGHVTARGPGLGLEWDEAAVARCLA
jgi:mandelate racemase